MDEDPPPEAERVSAEAFQRLRTAAGLPWFGLDIDSATLPLEGRLDAGVDMDKGCYMGQETVSRIVFRGHVNRILMGVRFSGPAPRVGSSVLRDGREVGRVTSAAGAAGLAMVRFEDAVAGAPVTVGGAAAELFVFGWWPKPLSRKVD